MSKKIVRCEHQVRDGTQYPGCGAEIVLVLYIPAKIQRDKPRTKLPLNAVYDPDCGIPPSHAVSLDWTRCRRLEPGETPEPHEHPALIHFATCPHRKKTVNDHHQPVEKRTSTGNGLRLITS